MADAIVQVNGRDVASAVVFVPNEGAWFVDLNISSDEPLDGMVTIKIGASTLKGTTHSIANGTHGMQRKARVIAGGGGWGTILKPLSYSVNDAGIKAATVAADAAKSAGEVMGSFAGGVTKLGAHYLRDAGPASRTLEDAARGVPWWVDYAGITHVGPRSITTADPKLYDIISCDTRSRNVVLSVADLEAVGIGSTLVKDLDAPMVVQAFEIEVAATGIRMRAWCGQGRTSSLASSLRAIVKRTTDQRITWPVRYRVLEMSGDRVSLQIVKKADGVPDAISVAMWPGAGSMHTIAARGAEVIVQFVDGDRSDPIITNFAGRNSHGAMAERLVLGASSGQGADAARKGDVVNIALPPFNFVGTIGVLPATGLLTAILPSAMGVIVTGAPGVGIGNDKA